MSHELEQKKIAKNTMFLYIRMGLVMLVSFYTSRVVLENLGIVDYGIYNIVGSIVVSFAFVQNSLMSSSQRFMSYSIGNNDNNCSQVFSVCINIHIALLVCIIIVLETIGTYCLFHIFNIPHDRLKAAFWVFQFSLIVFAINMIRLPFVALIVSREKMSIYAYYSIFDVVLNLIIAFLISENLGIDRLIFYAALMTIGTAFSAAYVIIYCYKKLRQDIKYQFIKDRTKHKEVFSFASWNLVGGLSSIASTEGPNYFMNYFLGVTVNAAMGVAKQVSRAVYSFSANFQTAFNPQIVKSYASGDLDYLFRLIFRTSKLSFYLIFVVAAPFIVCCNDIIDIWLVDVPKYAPVFCICMLLSQLVSALSSPFWMAAHAIGNIKAYQLSLCFLNLLIIPISYIVLHFGQEPYWILIAQIFINLWILLYRCNYLHTKISFPQVMFMKQVFLRVFVLIPAMTFPIIILVSSITSSVILNILLTSISSLIVVTLLFLYFGLNDMERIYIINLIKSKVRNIR